MKKDSTLLLASFFLLFLFTVLPANEGFTGPSSGKINKSKHTYSLVSTEEAKKMPDDALVTLQGHIILSLGGKKYIFRDAAGEITVEIERNIWRGLSVNETDRVEISGEVEQKKTRVEIDVKSIKKL